MVKSVLISTVITIVFFTCVSFAGCTSFETVLSVLGLFGSLLWLIEDIRLWKEEER